MGAYDGYLKRAERVVRRFGPMHHRRYDEICTIYKEVGGKLTRRKIDSQCVSYQPDDPVLRPNERWIWAVQELVRRGVVARETKEDDRHEDGLVWYSYVGENDGTII